MPSQDPVLARLPSWAAPLIDAAYARAGRGEDNGHESDVDDVLKLCAEHGARLALPGGGRTAERFAVLAALGRADLTTARVFEAHTDALAIIAESGAPLDSGKTWGVFAAEAAGTRLTAAPAEQTSAGPGPGPGPGPGDTVSLTGEKPWCSLGGVLDAALVTAHIGEQRGLFAVDLRRDDVRADPPHGWVARGLRAVPSGSVHFAGTPATPVGNPGWYLRRAGFAWGGIGVAACWHGGARGVADTLTRAPRRRDGDDIGAMHVGAVDAALHASAAALTSAAHAIDSSAVADPAMLALRTRAVVASAAEQVLRHAGHALGPAPLAFDAAHAARVADLTLYLRQHHGERDLAALGRAVLAASE